MSESRFVYSDLDGVFHAPARLSIATALYTTRVGMTFSQLKDACDLTDGNLSRHIARLETDHAVVVDKHFIGRKPQTTVRLSPDGRVRFEEYLQRLKTIVDIDAAPQTGLAGDLVSE